MKEEVKDDGSDTSIERSVIGSPKADKSFTSVQSFGHGKRLSLGGRISNPAAELAKYENEFPSVNMIEDFKNVIEDHGLKYEEIRATAEAYDYLRIARCRSAAISEQEDNNDRK